MGNMLMQLLTRTDTACKFTLKPSHSVRRLPCPVVRRLLFSFPFCLALLTASSQKFPASTIQDSLKENANMVVRLEEEFYEIKSTGQAIKHERHVFTILNEKGEEYATYTAHYNNKSVILNSVNAYMYDANGKELRHFKKKDMEDHPAFDGSSFVNDERYKVGSFYSHTYPYTVDFEEEGEITELIHIYGWYPQGSIKNSVETSVYSITAPSDYALRYRMLNSKLNPVITDGKGNKKTYTWEIHNVPAFDEIPYLNYANYAPFLLIGLGEIEMGGYKGSMSTWNDYAKFYGSMQKGRDILPDETKLKVQELTKGITDPVAIIAVLYNYLQQNTHYVGIQLGIGGWQTYDATYVATNKYGDCKALSNFMISLLKEKGIKAHAVVIKSGEEYSDFVKDFTYDPFNHVICCVPLGKDTIWLECTSQFKPPGYLGESTANRYGLLIDDNGGGLVHTPAYLLADNVQQRKISADLDNEGNLKFESKTSYKALCQAEAESAIHRLSMEEQLNKLKSEFSLPTYDVLSFDYREDYSKRIPVIHESIKIAVNNYAQVSGKRIFINPDILTRFPEKLPEEKNRRFTIDLKKENHYIDSIQIAVPAGYETESKPRDLELKTKFGKYSNKTIYSDNKISYYREFEQYSGRFPAGDYGEVEKFYNDIYEADHKSIVLVKKN
jgi:hypothetical protein